VRQLQASDNARSFRGLEIVYVSAEAGAMYANLGGPYRGAQGGAAFGLGAGVRFLQWTIGIRGRVAPLPAYTLYEGNVEAGFHLQLGAWDPYVNVHGGYAHASMNSEQVYFNVPPVSVAAGPATPPSPSGGDVGGSLGTDYYFSALFSVGADVTLDALFMSSPEVTLVSQGGQLVFPAASATGIAFMGSLHVGVHFDL
jgi:hypothetical protein